MSNTQHVQTGDADGKSNRKRKPELDLDSAAGAPKQAKKESKEITIDLTADDEVPAAAKAESKQEMESGKCEECGALVTWPAYSAEQTDEQGEHCCVNNCFKTLCKACHPNSYDMCKECTQEWMAEVKSFEKNCCTQPRVVGICVECHQDVCGLPDDVCEKCKRPVCISHMESDERTVCIKCHELEQAAA